MRPKPGQGGCWTRRLRPSDLVESAGDDPELDIHRVNVLVERRQPGREPQRAADAADAADGERERRADTADSAPAIRLPNGVVPK
jgi:hypothetical protein